MLDPERAEAPFLTAQPEETAWRLAAFWTSGPGGVSCELCPHLCSLGPGESGLCHVRRNSGGVLETSISGVSVRHYTPIERKPLYHFRPGLEVLTLAAPGCTFACAYCQNYRLSQFGRDRSASWRIESLQIEELVKDVHARKSAIAFSYTEPALAVELTLELAQAAKPLGIPMLWKTNGYLTAKAGEALGAVLSAANIDIKAADDRRHRAFSGASLEPVWETVALWRALGVWVEVSTPLIPKVSDRLACLASIANRLASISPDIPWHLVRFNPDYKMTSRFATPQNLLSEARSTGLASGLRHVYVERALGSEGRTTFCHACGSPLITRGVWSLSGSKLDGSRCPSCETKIEGVWL
jgi:pyruvate formate lyase activating enzyme